MADFRFLALFWREKPINRFFFLFGKSLNPPERNWDAAIASGPLEENLETVASKNGFQASRSVLPDLFGTTYQNGEKYANRPQNIPNGCYYLSFLKVYFCG
jgi:hypothetical protein